MWLLDAIAERVNWIRSYLLGRGLFQLAIITAGVVGGMTSVGFMLPALAVAAGSALLNAYMATRTERMHEQRLIRTYRGEIAATAGVPPRAVTREHLYAVARDNTVLSQALTRERYRARIDSATGILAGLATFGLLYAGFASGLATLLVETFGTIAGGALSVFSIGMVSGASGLVLNNGLGHAISENAGLTKASAHEQIMRLEWQVRRGRTVAPAQVFGVLVASNASLERNIRQQFGKSYDAMNGREREQVLQSNPQQEDIALLTQAINAKTLRPSSLAFVFGQRFDRIGTAPPVEESMPSQAARGSFVERYATARTQQSFRDKLAAERSAAATSARTV